MKRGNVARDYRGVCIVSNCGKPCWKQVCRSCARKIRTGTLPPQGGVEPNPECEVPGCTRPAATKNTPQCRGHDIFTRYKNPDPTLKRGKVPNGAEKPECSTPGCSEKATSKGFCTKHYESKSRTRLTTPCLTEGCKKYSKNPYCAKHLQQQAKYGFSWEGEYPTDRIREWRSERRQTCSVLGCEEKASSDEGVLCRLHRADFGRKGCSTEFYLDLMSRTSCEACGDTSRLVVDHDHGCPHPKDNMCEKCIRGRLCSSCNTAIGYARDNPSILRSLAEYLS